MEKDNDAGLPAADQPAGRGVGPPDWMRYTVTLRYQRKVESKVPGSLLTGRDTLLEYASLAAPQNPLPQRPTASKTSGLRKVWKIDDSQTVCKTPQEHPKSLEHTF